MVASLALTTIADQVPRAPAQRFRQAPNTRRMSSAKPLMRVTMADG
jgi:hypothetical protein